MIHFFVLPKKTLPKSKLKNSPMFLSKHIIVSVITEAYNLSYFCVWYEARVEIRSFVSCVCVCVC